MRGRNREGLFNADGYISTVEGTTEASDAGFDYNVDRWVDDLRARLSVIVHALHGLAIAKGDPFFVELHDDLVAFSEYLVDEVIRARLQAQILFLRESRDYYEALYAFFQDDERLAKTERLQEGFRKHLSRSGEEGRARAERTLGRLAKKYPGVPLPNNVVPFFPSEPG